MTCRFGTGMKWKEIANWKHFWFVLSLKRQSASSPSPGQTIPHWFWFPISHGTCSLVWKHCWLFATQHTAAQGSFISARTVKTPDLPSTQLQAMTVNFAASQRGCWDLLLFGQTSLRCFLSCIQIWSTSADICRASFPLAWLALTTATETGLFLTKSKYPFFLLKPWAVTGRENHPFHLWMLVKDYTLLWLQHPWGFCKDYCFVQWSTTAPRSSA